MHRLIRGTDRSAAETVIQAKEKPLPVIAEKKAGTMKLLRHDICSLS